MAKKRHSTPVPQTRRMTLKQIAAEIDRSPNETRKLLRKARFVGLWSQIGRTPTYHASAVEVLKAMVDVPHRPIPTGEPDWLSRYEGDT